MSFNVGDTVQLKSGGPDMTITRIGTSGGETMVWCAWFEGTKDTHALFPPGALKKPAEPSPTAGGRTAISPDAVEAAKAPDPTAANSAPVEEKDNAPLAEKNKKSQEAQIASVQSLIASLLKRS